MMHPVLIEDGDALIDHMQEVARLQDLIDDLIWNDNDHDGAVEVMDDRAEAYLNLYEFLQGEMGLTP